MAVRQAAVWAWILSAGAVLAVSACAAMPAANAPAPIAPPPPAGVHIDSGALTPPLLGPDAPRGEITAWLARNVPASRGRLVYINGAEAFWIEHQDVDANDDLRVTTTIQAENFADPNQTWRSSYEVTQFDCANQQQLHFYLTRYPGNALTGDAAKQGQLIRHGDFVAPTSLDFAHLRVACLAAYDRVRKRTYAIQMP